MSADAITVVRAYGPLLAKHIAPGHVHGYGRARRFDLFDRKLGGLGNLEELLRQLAVRADCAVVRGRIADPAHARSVRRLLYTDPDTGDEPTLIETPRSWLALDIDDLAAPSGTDTTDLLACAKLAAAVLPPAFHQVSLLVQATASHLIEPGMYLRLWFWLSRPAAGAELKHWLRSAPVDRSVFGGAQLVYTAAPVFVGGVSDPLPERLAVLFSSDETVRVPDPSVLVPPRHARPRPPLPDDARARSYADSTLASIAARVLRAPPGTRHDTLIIAARRLAELEQGGLVAADETEKLLIAAARGAGLEADGRNAEREVEAILKWARRSCEGERA